MPFPAKCFQSIDELAAALRSDDPPAPPILPGARFHLPEREVLGDMPPGHTFEFFGEALPEQREFERVHGTKGGNKIIAFGDGKQFLYRGQNRRWEPCLSTVWRSGQPSNDRELNHILSRTRIAEFEKLLKQHPMMELAREEQIEVDYDALAQHYGIPTFWLDITSSIDVACFFAVARFNKEGVISPCEEGTGMIYRVHWRSFEDPLRFFTSISHSPASRPGRQHGWSIGLNRQVDFDSLVFVERFDFVHSRSHSECIISSFASRLFPSDSITDVAQTLKNSSAVTMSGIKFALERDGCPAQEIERWSLIWGERLCNDLGLDVYLDEEFALTDAQIQAGLYDAALAHKSFLSEVCFRLVRTRKD